MKSLFHHLCVGEADRKTLLQLVLHCGLEWLRHIGLKYYEILGWLITRETETDMVNNRSKCDLPANRWPWPNVDKAWCGHFLPRSQLIVQWPSRPLGSFFSVNIVKTKVMSWPSVSCKHPGHRQHRHFVKTSWSPPPVLPWPCLVLHGTDPAGPLGLRRFLHLVKNGKNKWVCLWAKILRQKWLTYRQVIQNVFTWNKMSWKDHCQSCSSHSAILSGRFSELR